VVGLFVVNTTLLQVALFFHFGEGIDCRKSFKEMAAGSWSGKEVN
jgi:hypothetical protein